MASRPRGDGPADAVESDDIRHRAGDGRWEQSAVDRGREVEVE